jgi:hypothetical protein
VIEAASADGVDDHRSAATVPRAGGAGPGGGTAAPVLPSTLLSQLRLAALTARSKLILARFSWAGVSCTKRARFAIATSLSKM